MLCYSLSSGFCPHLLAGTAFLLLTTGQLRAEALQFRNDARGPVVVQGACVVRGMLRRDRPYLLNPSDKSPAITLPGDKIITIYDAKVPNRILFQGVVPSTLEDQLFSIRPDSNSPGLKLEKQPSKDKRVSSRP